MAQPDGPKLEWSEDSETGYRWLTVVMSPKELVKGRGAIGIPTPNVGLRGFVRRNDSGMYFACMCSSATPESDFTEVGEFKTLDKAKEAVELAYMTEQLRGERG